MRFFAPLALVLASATAFAAPTKYSVDPAHSTIGFSVRHMMISNVTGKFNDFTGTFTFDADKDALADATFTAKTASIDTGNSKRDDHLRSPDFFDATKFPAISFEKTSLKKTSKDHYKWTGMLNMHGESHSVTFDLEHRGTIKGMEGKMHAGFSATATIKRSEWGLKWNKAMEAGGVAVSDEVKLTLEVEAVQEDGAAPAAAAPAPGKKK